MYCKSVFLGLSLLFCTIALGQDAERPKKRCEDVIVGAINDSKALAECAAKQSIPEFDAALEKPAGSVVKFDAQRGLLRAGKNDSLKEIRGLVDGETTTDTEEAKKAHAIYLLGEFGTEEDVKRLENLLNSDYLIIVAETLIKRFSSSDRGIE